MCHKNPSIWHTIRPGLWWTVKTRPFRRNCSARSALLKSHKLGSQKHTYALERSCPQVWVKQRAHILYAHSLLTPAGVSLRLDGIIPTARGYYSCPMPESVTNTQNQEVFFFLQHRKPRYSLRLWLQQFSFSSASLACLRAARAAPLWPSTRTSPSILPSPPPLATHRLTRHLPV